jgi:hypothetical protein
MVYKGVRSTRLREQAERYIWKSLEDMGKDKESGLRGRISSKVLNTRMRRRKIVFHCIVLPSPIYNPMCAYFIGKRTKKMARSLISHY